MSAGRLVKKSCLAGGSKTAGGKAPEIPKSEAYKGVRCNDEDRGLASLRLGDASDGRFSAAC